ncbi:MAG: DUF1365 domain-containing protein [Hyphomicrobiaceae bacterium]|nr:DUF1365 domain-containing protein [Hyphomicrobiaceae bacterium]
MNSGVYTGEVVHVRHRPKRHRLRYSVFSLLLDLDEIVTLDRKLRLFARNRFALFSFHDADHGDLTGADPRLWVNAQLVAAGYDPTRYRVAVLCYPRILGYVFNPLSVYFCRNPEGTVEVILYEVCNTFGERHTYVIPAEGAGRIVQHGCEKKMYVSPFVPMECAYDFKILPPGERVLVSINERDGDGPLLFASFSGRRKPLTDGQLFKVLLRYPLMTLRISVAIHWQALLLLAKGLRVFRHAPAPQRVSVSVVARTIERNEHSDG